MSSDCCCCCCFTKKNCYCVCEYSFEYRQIFQHIQYEGLVWQRVCFHLFQTHFHTTHLAFVIVVSWFLFFFVRSNTSQFNSHSFQNFRCYLEWWPLSIHNIICHICVCNIIYTYCMHVRLIFDMFAIFCCYMSVTLFRETQNRMR